MKKIFIILFLTILLLTSVNDLFALPYTYSVTGTVNVFDENGNITDSLNITGELFLNALTISSCGSPAGRPNPNIYFTYDIPYFNFDVGGYEFYGESGRINSIYYGQPDFTGFTCTFDTFDLNGYGDWTSWGRLLSYSATFYYQDGTPYDKGSDPKDYYNIPYMINLSSKLIPGAGTSHYWEIDNMTMYQSTAPVPEPITLLLFGSGLLGLVRFRSKFNRKDTN